MEAGRELDALVAEKVFGVTIEWGEETPCPYCGSEMRYCGSRSRCTLCQEWVYGPYKDYSTDIAAAWEVVEKMLSLGHKYALRDVGSEAWQAVFREDMHLHHSDFDTVGEWYETAPLAICFAALKAKGIEVE